MAGHLFRDSAPYPIDVAGASGSYITDRKGKRYLDFMMGWCVGNAGWNNKEILKSISSFNGPVYVNPHYIYDRWENLADKLISLLPAKRGACFRATGGTEAVELALKISRAYNRRERFIAFKSAYHGQSLACMSLVAIPEHVKKFGPFPESYIQIEAKDWEETAAKASKIKKK